MIHPYCEVFLLVRWFCRNTLMGLFAFFWCEMFYNFLFSYQKDNAYAYADRRVDVDLVLPRAEFTDPVHSLFLRDHCLCGFLHRIWVNSLYPLYNPCPLLSWRNLWYHYTSTTTSFSQSLWKILCSFVMIPSHQTGMNGAHPSVLKKVLGFKRVQRLFNLCRWWRLSFETFW